MFFSAKALLLNSSNNLTGNIAMDNEQGISLDTSSNNNLTGSIVSNNFNGIILTSSSNNYLQNNNALNNSYGIALYSSDNTLIDNIASQNNFGIYLSNSHYNTLYKNDLVYNFWNAYDASGGDNNWDNGIMGNHYSDHDEPGENCIDSAPKDGICDAPYTTPGSSGSIDRYPLVSSGAPVISSTGKGVVYFETNTGTVQDLIAVGTIPPGGPALQYGLFRFSAANVPIGGSATLTLTYPDNLPPGTTYWKYGKTAANPTSHWYTIPSSINGNKLTITLPGNSFEVVSGEK